MTRYSLGEYTEETGVTAVDVQNRMTDFGVDAFWLSHEPWIVPEPFTPEAGEMWSKEEIDYWIDVLEHICDGGLQRSRDRQDGAPQPGRAQIDPVALDDPDRWATTWRAAQRKRGAMPVGD